MGISRLTAAGSQKLLEAIDNNTKLKPKYCKFSAVDSYDPAMTDLPNAWLQKDIDGYRLPNEDRIYFVCTANKLEATNSTKIIGIYLEDDTLFMVGEPNSPFPKDTNQRLDIQLDVSSVLNYIDTTYFDINITELNNQNELYKQKLHFLLDFYDSFYIDDLLNQAPFFKDPSNLRLRGEDDSQENLEIYNTLHIENCDLDCLLYQIALATRVIYLDNTTYEITKFSDHSLLTIYNADTWLGKSWDDAVAFVQDGVIGGRLQDNVLYYKHTDISKVDNAERYMYSTPAQLSDIYTRYADDILEAIKLRNRSFSHYSYFDKVYINYSAVGVHTGETIDLQINVNDIKRVFDEDTIKIEWFRDGSTLIGEGSSIQHQVTDSEGSSFRISVRLSSYQFNQVIDFYDVFVINNSLPKIAEFQVIEFDKQHITSLYANSTYTLRVNGEYDQLATVEVVPDISDVVVDVIEPNHLFKVSVKEIQASSTFNLKLKINSADVFQKQFDVNPAKHYSIRIPTKVLSAGSVCNKVIVYDDRKEFVVFDTLKGTPDLSIFLPTLPELTIQTGNCNVTAYYSLNNNQIGSIQFSKELKDFQNHKIHNVSATNFKVFDEVVSFKDLSGENLIFQVNPDGTFTNGMRYDFNDDVLDISKLPDSACIATTSNKIYFVDGTWHLTGGYQFPDNVNLLGAYLNSSTDAICISSEDTNIIATRFDTQTGQVIANKKIIQNPQLPWSNIEVKGIFNSDNDIMVILQITRHVMKTIGVIKISKATMTCNGFIEYIAEQSLEFLYARLVESGNFKLCVNFDNNCVVLTDIISNVFTDTNNTLMQGIIKTIVQYSEESLNWNLTQITLPVSTSYVITTNDVTDELVKVPSVLNIQAQRIY